MWYMFMRMLTGIGKNRYAQMTVFGSGCGNVTAAVTRN